MERKRRRWILVGALVVVAAWLLTWLVVAIVVPISETAACAGVEFRNPVQAEDPPDPRDRPPIGGSGGIAGDLRSALRGDKPVVYCDDFADPSVLRVGDEYVAYSTNTEDLHLPVLTSRGLFGTGERTEALPQLPGWTEPGKVWAPSVLPRPAGFVLYYATAAPNPARECLSRAVATRPEGPFADDSGGPLVCPGSGGAIDPSPFVDVDGRAYLLWKNYGETDGIVAQELSPDGLSLVGPARPILAADQPWEGGLIEAPSMVAFEGRYYLFYSGNDWATANYAIGYAVCDSPMGPCTKPGPGPWLASTENAEGPGGGEVFYDGGGQVWLVLHAWIGGKVGYPDGARNLFVVGLGFVNGAPVVV